MCCSNAVAALGSSTPPSQWKENTLRCNSVQISVYEVFASIKRFFFHLSQSAVLLTGGFYLRVIPCLLRGGCVADTGQAALSNVGCLKY